MNKKYWIVYCFFLLNGILSGQPQNFNFQEVKTPEGIFAGFIGGMAQDKNGIIWFAGRGGLIRYDGYAFKRYAPKGQVDFSLENICIDKNGVFWLSRRLGGLYRYDPYSDQYTLFEHDPKNPGSIGAGYVRAILEDRDTNLWIGTYTGLNRLDRKTNTFIKYVHDPDDPQSLSSNTIRTLYEDKQGNFWVGTGSSWFEEGTSEDGGLNRYIKSTGKFIRYIHDSGSVHYLSNNKIHALFEDSQGNFWIGTGGDGLHSLDRATGKITRHTYDPSQEKKLSRTQPIAGNYPVYISFIQEDLNSNLYIGTLDNGLSVYNLHSGEVNHFPSSSSTPGSLWSSLQAVDGNLFLATFSNVLLKYDPKQEVIPFYPVDAEVFSLSLDFSNHLWVGTNLGVIVENLITGSKQAYGHEERSLNSLSHNYARVIYCDTSGEVWVGTANGLNRFIPGSHTFKRYLINLSENAVSGRYCTINIIKDGPGDSLWVGTNGCGLLLMDKSTGRYRHYQNQPSDSNSLSGNYISGIEVDRKGNLWIGTFVYNGLNFFDIQSQKFNRYFPGETIIGMLLDQVENIWFSTEQNPYLWNRDQDILRSIQLPGEIVPNAISKFIQDRNKNIWIYNRSAGLIRTSPEMEQFKIYKLKTGENDLNFMNGVAIGTDENLYVVGVRGYYMLKENEDNINPIAPQIFISGFVVRDKMNTEIYNYSQEELNPKNLDLKYLENSFSFSFTGIHYSKPEANQHFYKLDNYDINWRSAQDTRSGSYYNLSPGNYVLRLKVVSVDGVPAEKAFPIKINPPWWQTGWAYIGGFLMVGLILRVYIQHRSKMLMLENTKLEQKINQRTLELQQSLEKLKSTQAQLIQSEKMASLGELTAGIAHEIQNPLNFVNNFSELNKELLNEIEGARRRKLEDRDERAETELLSTVIENEEKINHHGKRADAIVKSMLQHARVSSSDSGQKELTDINKLAEEYLRLAYQGYRAKDKDFNCTLHLELDPKLPWVKVVPQDIGRVFLNLFNNAFWACKLKSERVTSESPLHLVNYTPTITLITKNLIDKIEMRIRDNGPGIPQNIIDKIFQPFFTTKPTGQGTGLGLSLSYDLVTKGHNGTLKVSSEEGQGTEFIIQLPI